MADLEEAGVIEFYCLAHCRIIEAVGDEGTITGDEDQRYGLVVKLCTMSHCGKHVVDVQGCSPGSESELLVSMTV